MRALEKLLGKGNSLSSAGEPPWWIWLKWRSRILWFVFVKILVTFSNLLRTILMSLSMMDMFSPLFLTNEEMRCADIANWDVQPRFEHWYGMVRLTRPLGAFDLQFLSRILHRNICRLKISMHESMAAPKTSGRKVSEHSPMNTATLDARHHNDLTLISWRLPRNSHHLTEIRR